jgi:hypothetical protein
MPFPIKVCVNCGEEFELKPDKPGFANRCPECSDPEAISAVESPVYAGEHSMSEVNAARRRAIRDLLYREES